MTTTIRLSMLALALLATGCATSRHYASQVPAIDVPVRYDPADSGAITGSQRLPPLDAKHDSDVRDDRWWQGFGDPRLDRMVEQAMSANANLAAAGFALRQARLSARLAGNELFPQPAADAQAGRSRRVDTGDSTERSHAIRALVNWEIDLFGRLRAQRDVQTWRAQASADDLQATALALIAEVCTRYWQLAYLNQSIATGETDLAALARITELVAIQQVQGEVSLLEPREAQQRLESQRASQSLLQQQRSQVRHALAVLLDGQPWPQHDEPTSLEAVQGLSVQAGIPADVLARRPDLRAAERRLRASLANVDATARSYYPALSLTGSLGSGSPALSELLDSPVAALGLGLDLPSVNVARMRTDTQIAGAAYLQDASTFRATLHTALQEVADALSARERLQAQRAARLQSHEAARDVARIYEVRYREGATSLRIWLDAQQVLRSSELALAQVLLDQASNDVALVLALGGS